MLTALSIIGLIGRIYVTIVPSHIAFHMPFLNTGLRLALGADAPTKIGTSELSSSAHSKPL